jgi:tripartite-type tricarboxylate transporter receptor subunit TctC
MKVPWFLNAMVRAATRETLNYISSGAVVGTAVLLFSMSAVAIAEDTAKYPSATIRIVVPFSAGGTADALPRIVGNRLQARWKEPVIVVNRAGAGGNIGAETVAVAKPDGYTLLASPPGPIAINDALYKELAFRPSDFEPVIVMGSVPNVMDVLVHVPYSGSAPALQDIMGDRVDLLFDNLASSLPLHEARKLQILAVGSPKRIAALPDLPTVAEAGVPGFESGTWFAIVAPPKTSSELLDRLNKAVNEVLLEPDVKSKFEELGVQTVGGTLAQTSTFIAGERHRWGDLIRTAGIQAN